MKRLTLLSTILTIIVWSLCADNVTNGAHEIGHTLGMVHSEYGIMTPGQDSPGRRPEITRGNIQQCISSAFSRYSNSKEAKGTINGIVNSSRLPSAPYLLVDTIVLHDPKVIEPSKVLHDIWFLSQDTTIAPKKYSEWKLLHMDNVYIEAPVINKDLYHFLCDTLGIDSKSYQWCYLNPNWENMYCLVFQIRADYHEKNFKILTELVKYEYRSPFPIYRPGCKYEYYQMLVEIPEEFYINHIRKGLVPIPYRPASHNSCFNDYRQAYFCLTDSTGYVNFNDFITKNIIMSDNGADANAVCLIELVVIDDGKIEDINVTSNCDFCNAAVTKAVEISAPYWKLTHSARKKKDQSKF